MVLSRSAETIEEAINATLFKPVHSFEEFAKHILDNCLEMHEYTDHAEVSLAGDLILQVKKGETFKAKNPMN